MNRKISIVAAVLCLAAVPPLSWADSASHSESAGAYISDATLTTKVKTALLTEKNLDSTGIDVESTSGVVTLSGNVPSSAQIDQAVDVAKHVKGVKDVHNALHTKSDKD
jgi:osmotically-inducible protein OsmY